MWSPPKNLVENYLRIVQECLVSGSTFNKFKSENDYIAIVGTPSPYQLSHFMDKIRNHPDIISRFQDFQKNDMYGNPPYIIPEYNLSMGTIRYIHSLCDIKETFGSLTSWKIAEMGVGYGGLSFILNQYYDIERYHLIDLSVVQELATKYLVLLNSPSTTKPPVDIDLFISEFCLSEFDDADLYDFYDRYVKPAKNAYLQMNLIDPARKSRFINYMNEDFDLEIRNETHGTDFPAYIIVGKK